MGPSCNEIFSCGDHLACPELAGAGEEQAGGELANGQVEQAGGGEGVVGHLGGIPFGSFAQGALSRAAEDGSSVSALRNYTAG